MLSLLKKPKKKEVVKETIKISSVNGFNEIFLYKCKEGDIDSLNCLIDYLESWFADTEFLDFGNQGLICTLNHLKFDAFKFLLKRVKYEKDISLDLMKTPIYQWMTNNNPKLAYKQIDFLFEEYNYYKKYWKTNEFKYVISSFVTIYNLEKYFTRDFQGLYLKKDIAISKRRHYYIWKLLDQGYEFKREK